MPDQSFKPLPIIPTDAQTRARIVDLLNEVAAEGDTEEMERLTALLARMDRLRGLN
jgi:hypothetical protein